MEDGTRELSPNLMKEAEDLVYKDYQEILSGRKKEFEQIEEIRSKLKSLSGIVYSGQSSGKIS